MRIRFSDFDLVVNVKPDEHFKREGQDLFLEKEISYKQAVLGDVVDVSTLEGNIKIKVQTGSESGKVVRLRGQGVPYPQSHQKGDLYVVFKIKVPQKVSSRAKKLLSDLDEELT